MTNNARSGRRGEILARRAIEDHGFTVHNANVIFGANCPNIDLIVFARTNAIYIQVKWSEKPASSDSITIDGSPWTHGQLYKNEPIFNKHDQF
jgi:Holliday junction resolvase-like predicted endonuclease